MSLPDWLKWYATGICSWQYVESTSGNGTHNAYARRLGPIECNFDHDGEHWGGRADMNIEMGLQMPKHLSHSEIRSRISHAWAVLRAHHVLLRAKAVDADKHELLKDTVLDGRCFVVDDIQDAEQLKKDADEFLVFLEDYYADVDVDVFLRHAMNTARCFNSAEGLSKLYVFPLRALANGGFNTRMLMVNAHQISDGVTCYNWMSHFINLLNFTDQTNYHRLEQLGQHEGLFARLPPAQEDVYLPRAPGNLARTRWLWAISRILRHTRKPPPEAFPNPLRRETRLTSAQIMQPLFDKVLDYSITPPLSSFAVYTTLSAAATKNLIRLCREANVSFGAGCFTLVGLSMMLLYEKFYPSVKLEDRLPYVAGFPVNPRPFFNYSNSKDHGSMMLAFGDGLSMPFLPSSLPLEKRFKILATQTVRQLNLYQKTPRKEKDLKSLGARSANELIPSMYLMGFDIAERGKRPEMRTGVNPQGNYPATFSKSGPTNGVTAVGFRAKLMSWDGTDLQETKQEDLVKILSAHTLVRVRDHEFLVGTAADNENLDILASYDATYIDEEKAVTWRETIKNLLEPQSLARL